VVDDAAQRLFEPADPVHDAEVFDFLERGC
jgi:hypothetical protein